MSYYQAFNFTREPFSNTPDPGLFYHSRQHREALQKLEIALRLRRGLNLVIGDVGLGKTTLSRQLIQRISHDENLEYVLILDPGFSSEEEFLSFLLEQFTGTANFLQTSAIRLKEILKAHLFSRAQEEGKTLLLIIDEGQKLPDHCLEALRELLNYETNDHKLLQITIFAQKEFKITLKRHDNFNDRINFRYELTPLGFRDTRDLIFHRISASSDPNGLMAPQSPFTWGACLAIHRATQGSPRKIIHLCHHILMELIIHEKNQADYFFVRSRSGQILGRPLRIPFSRGLGKTSRWTVALSILAVCTIGYQNKMQLSQGLQNTFSTFTEKTTAQTPPVEKTAVLPVILPTPMNEEEIDLKVSPAPEKLKTIPQGEVPVRPTTHGWIKVHHQATLFKLSTMVYGNPAPWVFEKILAANPQIKDINKITTGMVMNFPVIRAGETSVPSQMGAFNIHFSKETKFKTAFDKTLDLRRKGIDARMFPRWDDHTGYHYNIQSIASFHSREDALRFQNQLDENHRGCIRQNLSMASAQISDPGTALSKGKKL